MSYQKYIDSLPKKRMGAGCLFFDKAHRLLILKPTYRDSWLIPGGVVEANESPREACIREVIEEIGVDCQLERLLCMDYVNSKENYGEALQFVFYGGVIAVEDVRLSDDEISDYCFVPTEQALPLLGKPAQRRIYWSLEGLKTKQFLYLENHEVVPF